MKPITFFDTETTHKSLIIKDIGAIKTDNTTFHSNSIHDFENFINSCEFICGHNAIKHDLVHLSKASHFFKNGHFKIIDTLYLSPLLFPAKPYHHLVKDDKILSDEPNNPVNDSIKARDLFFDEVNAFGRLEEPLKRIFYSLLSDKKEFKSFFEYISYESQTYIVPEIRNYFDNQICINAPLENLIEHYSIELAYCLALINGSDRYSITPRWVLINYPETERIMYLLRNNPCIKGCPYCNQAFDAFYGLKYFFGFDSFRTYGGEPLQE